MATQLEVIGQPNEFVWIFDAQAGYLLRRQDFDPEPFRLRDATASQIASAQPGWKPEVVFDAGAGAGLTARSLALDQHRIEPLRGTVHGRGQSRRATADDDQVVKRCLGAGT